MERCKWANVSPLDQKYHDEEWGVPEHDDQMLFEMLILEGAQAGLSWTTILKKREGYREAFDNFEIETVAAYGEEKIAQLLENPAIVRNKLKVNGTVTNAKLVRRSKKNLAVLTPISGSLLGGNLSSTTTKLWPMCPAQPQNLMP